MSWTLNFNVNMKRITATQFKLAVYEADYLAECLSIYRESIEMFPVIPPAVCLTMEKQLQSVFSSYGPLSLPEFEGAKNRCKNGSIPIQQVVNYEV